MPRPRSRGVPPGSRGASGFSSGAWISCLWAPTGQGVRVVRTTNKVQKWMRETLSHPSPGLFGSVRAAEKYFFVTGQPKKVSPFPAPRGTWCYALNADYPVPTPQHPCIPSSQPRGRSGHERSAQHRGGGLRWRLVRLVDPGATDRKPGAVQPRRSCCKTQRSTVGCPACR